MPILTIYMLLIPKLQSFRTFFAYVDYYKMYRSSKLKPNDHCATSQICVFIFLPNKTVLTFRTYQGIPVFQRNFCVWHWKMYCFLHGFKIELSYLWQIKYIWKYFRARKYKEKMTCPTRYFQEGYWELRIKNVVVQIWGWKLTIMLHQAYCLALFLVFPD